MCHAGDTRTYCVLEDCYQGEFYITMAARPKAVPFAAVDMEVPMPVQQVYEPAEHALKLAVKNKYEPGHMQPEGRDAGLATAMCLAEKNFCGWATEHKKRWPPQLWDDPAFVLVYHQNKWEPRWVPYDRFTWLVE